MSTTLRGVQAAVCRVGLDERGNRPNQEADKNLQSAFGTLAIATRASASAQAPPIGLSDASLERAYWACIALDSKNAAAGLRMDEAAVVGCSAISKELQTRRFGGDFGRLHEWTRARRAAMAKRP